MSKLIIEMEMPQVCMTKDGFYGNCPMNRLWCVQRNAPSGTKMRDAYAEMKDNIPSWCPIVGVLPEEHGDLIDRHKTAEELNEMADEVYNDFPLVDRETLASWDHGIRMAAQYVQNLAGRKDAAERKGECSVIS